MYRLVKRRRYIAGTDPTVERWVSEGGVPAAGGIKKRAETVPGLSPSLALVAQSGYGVELHIPLGNATILTWDIVSY
jgi:hypothetical protein